MEAEKNSGAAGNEDSYQTPANLLRTEENNRIEKAQEATSVQSDPTAEDDAAEPPDGSSGEKPTVASGPPIEPPLVWEVADADREGDEYDPDRALADLAGFHLRGRRPANDPGHDSAGALPATLHPFRDLTQIRHDYPVCLVSTGDRAEVKSLTTIIDETIAGLEVEGEESERLKRRIYKVEATIKSLIGGMAAAKKGRARSKTSQFSELWDQAADLIMHKTTSKGDRKNELRDDLKAGRAALAADGELIDCGADAPARMFPIVTMARWRERCGAWIDELDALIRDLQNILKADFNRSLEAKSPKQLRASVGSENEDDLDFEAMSLILSESRMIQPIPEDRRKRIENSLAAILEMRPVYAGVAAAKKDEPPFAMDMIVNDCAAAVENYRTRMRRMVEFFRAVNIARLEVGNRYRDGFHDEFFSGYNETFLSDDQRALCPPVLLQLDGAHLAATGHDALFDILGRGTPIKVLVSVDDVSTPMANSSTDGAGPTSTPVGWPARLAGMAMALDHVYVTQTPVSNVAALQRGFAEGVDHQGPALFSVFVGNSDHTPGLPRYLAAAAAAECRVFPVFSFAPGAGSTWAERFDITATPNHDQDWPKETVSYQRADEEKVDAPIAFTPGDFFYCDVRFARHFWLVPPAQWHKDMVPLSDFFLLGKGGAGTKIPYITVIDAAGSLGRVVVSWTMVESAARSLASWHTIQELGGVNNSHANNLLAIEKDRLAEEKQREVEAIEKKYTDDLDRDLAGLTQEIVQRIAAQLTSQSATGPMVFSAPAAAPSPASVPTPAAAPEPAVEEADEDDEVVTFDDPYIDTPLCTSCNDCTQLNSQMFAYNGDKRAYIKDVSAGTFEDLVKAAEKCPVKIIHPGKPKNPDEPGLEALIKRAAPFN